MDPIIIPTSKTKTIYTAFLGFGFVLLCFWLWPASENFPLFPAPVVTYFIHPVIIAGILLFLPLAILCCFRIFNSKPGLIIDQQGLFDNSSGAALGQIYWNDVEKVETIGPFIAIRLKHPQDFIRTFGFIKRMIGNANMKIYGAPVVLSPKMLNKDPREIEEAILKFYNKNSLG